MSSHTPVVRSRSELEALAEKLKRVCDLEVRYLKSWVPDQVDEILTPRSEFLLQIAAKEQMVVIQATPHGILMLLSPDAEIRWVERTAQRLLWALGLDTHFQTWVAEDEETHLLLTGAWSSSELSAVGPYCLGSEV